MGRMEVPQPDENRGNSANPSPVQPDLAQTVGTPLQVDPQDAETLEQTMPHQSAAETKPVQTLAGVAPAPAGEQSPSRGETAVNPPVQVDGRPTPRAGAGELPPPPVSLPPRTGRRSPPWRRLTLLGLLALIVIAVTSGLAGYRSGIGVRQEAEATQIAAQLQSQYDLAVQEIEAGQFNRARQRLEYIIQKNPGFPGVTEKLAQVLLSANSTATPTIAPTPTVSPTPDTRNVEEKFAQAQTFLQNSDWTGAIDMLLSVRKADLNYQPVLIDDMLYVALRNRGRDKILKSGDLEGGIYDLTLAQSFGPLDADSKSYQTWAELYLRGASFWKLDWSQSVYYFAQVAPALPNLRDGSGMTATERYRQALAGYGDTYAKAEDWCSAAEQYELSLSVGSDTAVEEKFNEALSNCEGDNVDEEGQSPAESPQPTLSETLPAGATVAPTEAAPAPTEVLVTEAAPAPTEVVVTEAPPAETPVEQPTQDPAVTPSP